MAKKLLSRFRPSMTLTDCLWLCVNRGKYTPGQLVDKIDYSESSLKRASLDGDSGAGFNLRKLIPFMNAQGETTILDFLNYSMGQISIPIPKSGRSKKDRMKSANDFQRLTTDAISALNEYNDKGSSQEKAIDMLHQVMKGAVELMEEVKKGNQIELDL